MRLICIMCIAAWALPVSLHGQSSFIFSISGKVTDSSGSPLIAVNVTLEGSNRGTATDEHGKFIFTNIPSGEYVLSFSAIGFSKQKLTMTVEKESQSINIKLVENIRQLSPVVVTATRNDRVASDIPVKVSTIDKQQIQQTGSLRLNDILAEQTGLTIINDHGAGLQVQGLDSDYTLLLINGEPVIGRTAGTLDLNRITVGNIKQVEIVKGPGSSLYGSEALAGVVNIITDRASGTGGSAALRYGSNNTTDLALEGQYKSEKSGLYLFGNRYSTNGYDLSKDVFGQTVDPFSSHTLGSTFDYNFSSKTNFSINGKYFTETQQSKFKTGTQQQTVIGAGEVTEWSINPKLTHSHNDQLKLTFRFYGTTYNTESLLEYKTTGEVYDRTSFGQSLYKPELQAEYFVNARNIITGGVGNTWEAVEATRYQSRQHFSNTYLFGQYEWLPLDRLNITAGARIDMHSAYQSQLSPKVALKYDVLPWLSIRGVAGVGFKAPDFRQLYLNFTNSVAGYSVFGAGVVTAEVESMQTQGLITEILTDLKQFHDLKAESSLSFNLEFLTQLSSTWSASVNLFQNNISNLIETVTVARKTNGQAVFSYLNKDEVYTQGFESDMSYSPAQSLRLSVGYQYLVAKDRETLSNLNDGNIYARDPDTQETYRVSKSEYGGLFNRSKHTANVKAFYHHAKSGWGASLRINYRSRYGFADRNGNGILDIDQEYINGYATVNTSITKIIGEVISIQAGCDNLFDYKNPEYITSLPGRLFWGTVRMNIKSKNKNKP
ncbi:TonB-dependent receptor [Fulvivirga imtechensis AK7]|uniref:TonB-dependent receptor n=1 Tax=Fulvivirga imtechensis AK7 TaxID=1237149 RepID=L8JLG4_9BACT|nr:TonB-dependent receptor [Fulvivirga imtechensis]ELR69093.1 TonB-dependent receptor [Fulvivirga imtechensis AK7]